MSDMKKKILEAFIRDGILEDDASPISESNDYGWEYSSLAEAIDDCNYQEYLDETNLVGDQTKEYEIGDIIYTNKFYSPASKSIVSGHKILVITSKRDEEGVVHYRGFELSSKVNKANIHGRYPNNLYISNYSTILTQGGSTTIPAILRVDDLVKFDSRDLSPTGTLKGKVTDEFLEFVQKAYSNYRAGRSKDNLDMRWER